METFVIYGLIHVELMGEHILSVKNLLTLNIKDIKTVSKLKTQFFIYIRMKISLFPFFSQNYVTLTFMTYELIKKV